MSPERPQGQLCGLRCKRVCLLTLGHLAWKARISRLAGVRGREEKGAVQGRQTPKLWPRKVALPFSCPFQVGIPAYNQGRDSWRDQLPLLTLQGNMTGGSQPARHPTDVLSLSQAWKTGTCPDLV